MSPVETNPTNVKAMQSEDLATQSELDAAIINLQGQIDGITVGGITDNELLALAATVAQTDRLPYFDSSTTANVTPFTSQARALLDDTSFGAMLTTLGISPFAQTILDDSDAASVRATITAQAADPQLDDLAALSSVANLSAFVGFAATTNTIPYFTSATTMSTVVLNASTTLSPNSDLHVATQKATKAYIDGVVVGANPDSSDTTKGLTKLSVAATTATSPIAAGDNDPRLTNATTSNRGIVKLSLAATTSTQPIVVGDNDPRLAAATDMSTTIKGVAKLSVAAAVTGNAIVVGDNDPRLADATTASKGVVRLSVNATTATIPIVVGDNDPRLLTSANTVLSAIGAVTAAADSLAYFTSTTQATTTSLTSFGRALVGQSTTTNARTALGLAIGTDVQAYDADLTTLGALGAGARTALGLAIGTNVQAWDTDLDALAGLTYAADVIPYFTAAHTATTTSFTSFARSFVAATTRSTARAVAGVEQVFRPEDYGAAGDWNGTTGTNDTVAIQACIDAIDANGGGTMLLGNKSYLVSSAPRHDRGGNSILSLAFGLGDPTGIRIRSEFNRTGRGDEGGGVIVTNRTSDTYSALYGPPSVLGGSTLENSATTLNYCGVVTLEGVTIQVPANPAIAGVDARGFGGCVLDGATVETYGTETYPTHPHAFGFRLPGVSNNGIVKLRFCLAAHMYVGFVATYTGGFLMENAYPYRCVVALGIEEQDTITHPIGPGRMIINHCTYGIAGYDASTVNGYQSNSGNPMYFQDVSIDVETSSAPWNETAAILDANNLMKGRLLWTRNASGNTPGTITGGTNLDLQMTRMPHISTSRNTAVTDADLAANQLAMWYDSATLAARLRMSGKDAGGTAYAPSLTARGFHANTGAFLTQFGIYDDVDGLSNPAVFAIQDGHLKWGAGGGASLDTAFYRNGTRALIMESNLSVTGTLGVSSYSTFTAASTTSPTLTVTNPAVAGATGVVVNLGGSVSLVHKGVRVEDSDQFDQAFSNYAVSTDTIPNWSVLGNGNLRWGPGGSSAVDVSFYRNATSVLRTDGSVIIDTNLTVTGNAVHSGAVTVTGALTGSSTISATTHVFGAADATLYRSTTNTIATTGYVVINSSSTTSPSLSLTTPGVAGATAVRMNFGNTGSLVHTGLALEDIDSLDNAVQMLALSTDTVPTFRILGTGSHKWGPGGSSALDVTLTRSATTTLALTGHLTASDGIKTKVVAASVTDGSFTVTPTSGAFAFDTANLKIWVRMGNTWRSTAALT